MNEQIEEFELEKSKFADINAAPSDQISINIGGEKTVTVARSLLTRIESSALAAMFSGRHTLRANKDGAIFIDRDADTFSLLITYLRNNCKMP